MGENCSVSRIPSLCGVVPFLLLLISISTDNWIKSKTGLWRTCSGNPERCNATDDTVSYITGGFMLLSLLCCLIGVIFGIGSKLRIGGIILLLSGCVAVLVMLIFTGMIIYENNNNNKDKRKEFGWSYIVGWSGTISALAAGCLQLYVNKHSVRNLSA